MAKDRFLLIKAWSYILWMDMDHVLSQLLIAELTDRTPVIYWPTCCLHNGYIHTNGFELYFEPVSDYTIFDVANSDYTFYPPVWDENNLLADDPSKETWAYRNIGDMLTCSANVLVGDVYFDMYSLIPFIGKNMPEYGMTVRQIYRYLFKKYIRIKSDIRIEIEGFYNSWLREHTPVLAVHVCRPDQNQIILKNNGREKYRYFSKSYRKDPKSPIEKKAKISPWPWKRKALVPNEAYHKEIRQLIEKYDIQRIFLITNSVEILNEYRQKYGSMVVATDCKRMTDDDTDSYLENPMVKRRRGIETLKDACLAAKCEFFIGNDFSSLSQAIAYMKEWDSSSAKLLYWKVGKRKYPINRQILTSSRRQNIFQKAAAFLRKRFAK
jgi:hypothetical protein